MFCMLHSHLQVAAEALTAARVLCLRAYVHNPRARPPERLFSLLEEPTSHLQVASEALAVAEGQRAAAAAVVEPAGAHAVVAHVNLDGQSIFE